MLAKGLAVLGVVVTMLTSEGLAAALPLVVALELHVKAILGCSFSWSIRPYFIAFSICTPIS